MSVANPTQYGINLTNQGPWTKSAVGLSGSGTATLAQVRSYLIATYFQNGLGGGGCFFDDELGCMACATGTNGLGPSGWGTAPNENNPIMVFKGYTRAGWVALINWMYANYGKPWKGCYWHEPEPAIAKGTPLIPAGNLYGASQPLTVAYWQAYYQDMKAGLTDAGVTPGAAALVSFAVKMDWYTEFDAAQAPLWPAMLPIPGVALADAGMDMYDPAYLSPTQWNNNMGPGGAWWTSLVAMATACNCPLSFTELGFILSTKAADSVAALNARLSALYAQQEALGGGVGGFGHNSYYLDFSPNGTVLLNNSSSMAIVQDKINGTPGPAVGPPTQLSQGSQLQASGLWLPVGAHQ